MLRAGGLPARDLPVQVSATLSISGAYPSFTAKLIACCVWHPSNRPVAVHLTDVAPTRGVSSGVPATPMQY